MSCHPVGLWGLLELSKFQGLEARGNQAYAPAKARASLGFLYHIAAAGPRLAGCSENWGFGFRMLPLLKEHTLVTFGSLDAFKVHIHIYKMYQKVYIFKYRAEFRSLRMD